MSYKPTWSRYEEAMRVKKGDEALKATEAFLEERERETTKSIQARKWEEDRKKEMFREKPNWVKQRLEQEQEQDPTKQFIKEVKQGGSFQTYVTPMGGYILIELLKKEKVTESGLYLPDENSEEPNQAIVLKCGRPLEKINVYNKLDRIPCPVDVGQKILIKKFCGLELDISGKNCRLIQFTDVLAVIND